MVELYYHFHPFPPRPCAQFCVLLRLSLQILEREPVGSVTFPIRVGLSAQKMRRGGQKC